MLNVAAYIPKDLSTADLQKKKPLKATNVFVIQEFSHETQPLQEFCSKISLENLHKSSLSVCSKYANPRNSQCRQTLGKSTHTPHHVLVWLFLCAFWVMSLWFHIPHHTFPVNNTNNISLLTTKVPLRAPPGWQLYQDCKSYTGQSPGNTQLLKHTKQQENPRLEAETKQSKVQKYLMLKVIKHWNNFTRWILHHWKVLKQEGMFSLFSAALQAGVNWGQSCDLHSTGGQTERSQEPLWPITQELIPGRSFL